LVYLLLVPLTLGYLNAYEYGIWLTLSSLLSWIDSFDIGLGNGLRNKLAAAMAEEDKEKARSYVSTTFFMLLFITGAIIVVFSFLINIVDWYTVLNVDKSVVGNIGEVILASLLFFCLNFVLKFIGNIYQALQLPAVNYLINFLGHLISLIVIYALTQTTKGYLLWVAIAYSAAPPLVYLLFYPITFTKLYPYLSPSIKYYKREYLKDLLSLSMLFFILQVMGIVLFSLSNLLISNFFGPDQVTPYNIAYRYFSVVPMVFSLLSAPLWSATTDAYI
jgi:O-antigen/teichoic acid export membrane protein